MFLFVVRSTVYCHLLYIATVMCEEVDVAECSAQTEMKSGPITIQITACTP